MVSNKKMVSIHVAEYKNIINDLRQEIDDLKLKLNDHGVDYYKEELQNHQPLANNFMRNENVGNSGDVKENQKCPCWCGRAEDDVEMKKIQEEIFENF